MARWRGTTISASVAVERIVMQQKPPCFVVGGEQNDPCRFKSPAHLIARRFVDLETAFGSQERFNAVRAICGPWLLSVSCVQLQQRASGPRLSGSDRA